MNKKYVKFIYHFAIPLLVAIISFIICYYVINPVYNYISNKGESTLDNILYTTAYEHEQMTTHISTRTSTHEPFLNNTLELSQSSTQETTRDSTKMITLELYFDITQPTSIPIQTSFHEFKQEPTQNRVHTPTHTTNLDTTHETTSVTTHPQLSTSTQPISSEFIQESTQYQIQEQTYIPSQKTTQTHTIITTHPQVNIPTQTTLLEFTQESMKNLMQTPTHFTDQNTTYVPVLITDAQHPIIESKLMHTSYTVGSSGSLYIEAYSPDGGSISYQWYSNSINDYDGSIPITNATDHFLEVPVDTEGIFYYYTIVTNTNTNVNGNQTATWVSPIIIITINPQNYDMTYIPSNDTIIEINSVYNIFISHSVGGQADSNPWWMTAQGQVIYLNAKADLGYEFHFWEVVSDNVIIQDPFSTNTSFIMPNSEVHIYAHFIQPGVSIISYYVYLSASNGVNTMNQSHYIAEPGEIVTLHVTPEDGYEFDYWDVFVDNINVDVLSPTISFIMPSHHVSFSANFKRK